MCAAARTTRLALALALASCSSCAVEPEVAAVDPEPGVAAPDVTLEPPISADEPAPTAEPVVDAVVVAPERWAELKAEIRGKFPGVDQLSVPELEDWLRADREQPLLLDVRQPKEYEVGHLEGAVLAADEAAALEALDGAPLDRPIVLYCSVGYRSSALAEQLAARGYTRVRNLEGSIFEWANRGQPVVSNGERVERVHPYDTDWGRLLRRDYWSFGEDADGADDQP